MGGVGIVSHKPSRRIAKIPISLGPGGATTVVNLPGLDLSHAQMLALQLYLTAIGTDVGDTLDVRFQDTRTGDVWNTRARFSQVLGNIVASAAAPYVERLALYNLVTPTTAEKAYVESGSVGGVDIPAQSVRNGPFLGVRRDPGLGTGGFGLTNTWRIQYITVDAGGQNASFVGTLTIWAE